MWHLAIFLQFFASFVYPCTEMYNTQVWLSYDHLTFLYSSLMRHKLILTTLNIFQQKIIKHRK